MLMRNAFVDEEMTSRYLKTMDAVEEKKLKQEQPILDKRIKQEKAVLWGAFSILGVCSGSASGTLVAMGSNNNAIGAISGLAIGAATLYGCTKLVNTPGHDQDIYMARLDRLNSKKVKLGERIKKLSKEELEEEKAEAEILQLKIAKQFAKTRISHYQGANISVSVRKV